MTNFFKFLFYRLILSYLHELVKQFILEDSYCLQKLILMCTIYISNCAKSMLKQRNIRKIPPYIVV